jgi:hypothetical protein
MRLPVSSWGHPQRYLVIDKLIVAYVSTTIISKRTTMTMVSHDVVDALLHINDKNNPMAACIPIAVKGRVALLSQSQQQRR